MFVRDSKVNVRQHAHRESDPFLCDKKNESIPTSLNRRGMYSHKKTNARLFLSSSMVFVLKSSERVLVLRESLKCSRLEPLVARNYIVPFSGQFSGLTGLHPPEYQGVRHRKVLSNHRPTALQGTRDRSCCAQDERRRLPERLSSGGALPRQLLRFFACFSRCPRSVPRAITMCLAPASSPNSRLRSTT